MVVLLQTRVQKLVKFSLSLFLCWLFSFVGYAQTILSSGDILTVSIGKSNSTIEIVPILDLEENTKFYIRMDSNIESTVEVVLKKNLNAGNSLVLTSNSTDQFNIDGQLLFDEKSDRITILQKQLNEEKILNITSWGGRTSREIKRSSSDIPNIYLGEGLNHQYYLKNGATGTPTMITKMVTDPSNWQVSKKPFPKLGTSFKILSAPVIVFSKNFSTIMEGDSIPLNVAIYEHDGSRLTVDVVLNEAFSTADTNDIYSFRSYTYNFTGLVGDAIYEISIPQYDDKIFEDRETLYFELQNLSIGNYGDFINHAMVIVDNEIPDIKISSFLDSKDANDRTIELVNNEKVDIDIKNWELHFDEHTYMLNNVLDLAPFERRVISISEMIKLNDKNVIKQAINQIRLIDNRGNIISSIDTHNLHEQIPKTFELNEEILTLNFKSKQDDEGQITSQITKLEKLNKTKILPNQGWAPLSLIDNKQDQEIVFWDEKLSRFRNITTIEPDSIAGLSFFQYLSPSMQLSSDQLNQDDSLAFEHESENIYEWRISLSATDGDKNGAINGSEGYNFIQYRGRDSLSVSSFIHYIEDQIGDNFIHSEIFKIDASLQYQSLSRDSFLMDRDFLWVKADSIFERTEFIFESILSYPVQDVQEVYEEPIFNFVVKAISLNGASTTTFNFYDIDSHIPHSRLNLCMNIGYYICNAEKLMAGVLVNDNWNSEISVIHQKETHFSYSLGFINNVASDISLQIEHWNMQSGWDLYIEDVEQNIRYPLSPGKEFILEYTTPFKDEISTQKEILVFKSAVINKKYNLLITTPDFNETGYDVPEVITLHQNYPNPFNPATFLSFYLPENQEVKLSIFNVVGQLITILQDGPLQFGEHHYEWNATGYPSGMYIYQLEVGNKVITRKMTLVK